MSKITYEDNGNIKIWTIGAFTMTIWNKLDPLENWYEVRVHCPTTSYSVILGVYKSLLKAKDAGIKDIRKMLKRYKKAIEKTELALEE